EHVSKVANYLHQQLGGLVAHHPDIFDSVRGKGLMIGLKMKIPAGEFIEAARKQGLIVLPAAENVVRLLPPLILSEAEAREGVALMDQTAAQFEARKAAAQ